MRIHFTLCTTSRIPNNSRMAAKLMDIRAINALFVQRMRLKASDRRIRSRFRSRRWLSCLLLRAARLHEKWMASRRHTENARGDVVRIDFCTHMTKVYIRSGFDRNGSLVVHLEQIKCICEEAQSYRHGRSEILITRW